MRKRLIIITSLLVVVKTDAEFFSRKLQLPPIPSRDSSFLNFISTSLVRYVTTALTKLWIEPCA